jgi:hypothetical protein
MAISFGMKPPIKKLSFFAGEYAPKEFGSWI